MTRAEFLGRLRQALSGLSAQDIDDIIADYDAHFAEAAAAGRAEAEVATALGDPIRLARELRAESRLRRWETQRTPASLVGAIVALGGLLAVDILILLPFLCFLAFIVFVVSIVLLAVGVGGFATLLGGLFHWHGWIESLARALTGVGLLSGSIGFAALLWLALEGLVKLLGGYARLHYQVLKPTERAT